MRITDRAYAALPGQARPLTRHKSNVPNDATEFAADLLLIVDGQIGYELDEGDPYAF